MRQLSNVLIGTFKKNYEQMIRTKRYKKTMNKYFEITEKISKINNKIDNTDDKKLLRDLNNKISISHDLEDDKKLISNQLEDIRINFNIFKSYYTKKAEFLYQNIFTNLNSILALKVVDRCWLQFEKLMFKSKTKKISK